MVLNNGSELANSSLLKKLGERMNIVLFGNCQNQQLMVGLSLVSMGTVSVHIIDTNLPNANEQLVNHLKMANVDAVVTNHNSHVVMKLVPNSKVLVVPTIYFGGFHPDVVYFSDVKTPSKPNFFMNNPTVSAIALWGILQKVPTEKIRSLFDQDVFEKLGYFDYFDISVEAIKKEYLNTEIPLKYIERHLASRDVFMYGPLHPKCEVILSLCFAIAEKLNLKTACTYESLVDILIDPLKQEYQWGCYPPLADRLGVNGSWFIRHYGQVFQNLESYISTLRDFIEHHQLRNGAVQMLERDKKRFDNIHLMDTVLRDYL